jgi:hypothetical protein
MAPWLTVRRRPPVKAMILGGVDGCCAVRTDTAARRAKAIALDLIKNKRRSLYVSYLKREDIGALAVRPTDPEASLTEPA